MTAIAVGMSALSKQQAKQKRFFSRFLQAKWAKASRFD